MKIDFGNLKQWKTFGTGEEAIDLLVQPISVVEREKLIGLIEADSAKCVSEALRMMVLDWRNMIGANDQPCKFNLAHLAIALTVSESAGEDFQKDMRRALGFKDSAEAIRRQIASLQQTLDVLTKKEEAEGPLPGSPPSVDVSAAPLS